MRLMLPLVEKTGSFSSPGLCTFLRSLELFHQTPGVEGYWNIALLILHILFSFYRYTFLKQPIHTDLIIYL